MKRFQTISLCLLAALVVFAAPDEKKVTLSGKVTDESTKKPITNFHLVIRQGSATEPGAILTDRKVMNPRGSFTVYVPPGTLNVSIEAAGHMPFEQMASGGTGKTMLIALQPGVMLKGRVIGPDNKPVANADVTIDYFSPASPQRRDLHATTDANGNYSILSQAGEKTVKVQAEGLLSEEKRVTAKKPSTNVPDIQMVKPDRYGRW